jgi:DNA-binding IclR family transcriptional regulator
MVVSAPTPDTRPSSILAKAFDLLRAFTPEQPVMSLTEISRRSGLPKSTVHRLLERLLDLDAVERFPHGYCVSLALSQLGAITPAAGGRDAAMPYLAWLHRGTGHTARYAVLRSLEVVYLEELTRQRRGSQRSRVGSRLPATCTAIGKALLAWEDRTRLDQLLRQNPLPALTPRSGRSVDRLLGELGEVRADGLAHEQDEAELGWSCVGAPIVVDGFAVAAISLQYPSDAPLDSKVEDAVRAAATRIARDIRVGLRNGNERQFPHPTV